MTDWTAQTQQGVERWIEAQQAWWREVLGGTGAASAQPVDASGRDAAREAVEAWRASAYRIVDAQAELLLATLHGHHDAEAQSLLTRWTDAQRALWQDWLAAAGGGPATAGSDEQQQAGREMVESLRAAAEHLVRSQAEWAKAWTDARADPGDSAR
jgi:uncharacterized protein YPO0396